MLSFACMHDAKDIRMKDTFLIIGISAPSLGQQAGMQ